MNKLIKEFESIAKGIHFNNKKDNQKLKHGGKPSTTHLLSKIFLYFLGYFQLFTTMFKLLVILFITNKSNKK